LGYSLLNLWKKGQYSDEIERLLSRSMCILRYSSGKMQPFRCSNHRRTWSSRSRWCPSADSQFDNSFSLGDKPVRFRGGRGFTRFPNKSLWHVIL